MAGHSEDVALVGGSRGWIVRDSVVEHEEEEWSEVGDVDLKTIFMSDHIKGRMSNIAVLEGARREILHRKRDGRVPERERSEDSRILRCYFPPRRRTQLPSQHTHRRQSW